HDSKHLIRVNPGTTLFISKKGTFQVAIVEYDSNGVVLKNSDYVTGEYKLTDNTLFISYVCATDDFTSVDLEEKLEHANLTVEIPFTHNRAKSHIPAIENIISLNKTKWENGSYSSSICYDVSSRRIRYKENIFIDNTKKRTKLFYKISSGYKIALIFIKNDMTFVEDSGFLTGEGKYYLHDDCDKIIPIVAR